MSRSEFSAEELAERREQGKRYEASRALARTQEEIRGIRIAINHLIKAEKGLTEEAKQLEYVLNGGANNGSR